MNSDAPTDIGDYISEVDRFVTWCDRSHLVVNTKKTEEMIFDPLGVGDLRPVVIHNQPVTQVLSYKYLGVYIDSRLTWSTHVDILCTRLQQRLHFLRRLRVHGVDKKFMIVFCQAVVESLIRYGITAWFGNLSVELRAKLIQIMHTAWKIIGVREYPTLQSIYEQATLRQANKIVADPSHVLHAEYQLLPHGRRFRAHRWRVNRYRFSFIPASVRLLNEQ